MDGASREVDGPRGLARTARAVVSALVAVALWAGGCSRGDCEGTYNCPALVPGQVAYPTDGGVTLIDVTTTAPCRVSAPDDGGVWSVSFNATIAAGVTKTCEVQGHLSDGTQVDAEIPFQSLHCCGNTAVNGDTVILSRSGAADASSN